MNNRSYRFVYWAPRILGLLYVLFLALFSLDVFEPGLSLTQILIGLFMHNIPTLVLLIVMIISWKYEIVGAVVFLMAAILYTLTIALQSPFEWYMISWIVTIAGPSFLIGMLFFLDWIWKKRGIQSV